MLLYVIEQARDALSAGATRDHRVEAWTRARRSHSPGAAGLALAVLKHPRADRVAAASERLQQSVDCRSSGR